MHKVALNFIVAKHAVAEVSLVLIGVEGPDGGTSPLGNIPK